MKLAALHEATTTWIGPLSVLVGSGDDYTLNLGTGAPDRPPLLYVPIPLSHLRQARRLLAHRIGELAQFAGALTHVGEAHVTISMGQELVDALGDEPRRRLHEAGLVDEGGRGIPVRVHHSGEFKTLPAAYYKDEADPGGPLVVAEMVEVPQLSAIRGALGLSALPTLPSGAAYVPHVTIGYIANLNKIHQSYVARHGSQPRQRSEVPHDRPGRGGS